MWSSVKEKVGSLRLPRNNGETILDKVSSAKQNVTDLMNETKNTLKDAVKKTIPSKTNKEHERWENKCIELVHDCFRDPAVLTYAIKESDFLKMDKTASNIQTQLERSKENINHDTPNTEGDLYYRKDPKRLDNELKHCNIDPTFLSGYDKIRYAATIMHALAQSGYMTLYTDNPEQVQEAQNFEQSLRSNVLTILMNIKITADQIKQLPIPEVYKKSAKRLLKKSAAIQTKADLLIAEKNELEDDLKRLLLAITNENRMQVSQALDSVIHQIIENEPSSMLHHNHSYDDLEWTTNETDESKTPEKGNSPEQLWPTDKTNDNELNRYLVREETVAPANVEIYAQHGTKITTEMDPRLRGNDILNTDNSDATIDIQLDKLRQYYSLTKVDILSQDESETTMSQPRSIEEETYPRHLLATAGILLITASASLALVSLTCSMPLTLCGLAIGATLIKTAMGASMGVGIACVFSSLLPYRFFKPNDFFDTDDKNKTPTNQQPPKYIHYEYCMQTNEYKPIFPREVTSDHQNSV